MTDVAAPTGSDTALRRLLELLDAQGYDFVTPTPLTHARVVARARGRTARDLREALGWSLPFRRADLPREPVDLLEAAGLLQPEGEAVRSAVRVSRVRGLLFLHSAYPTTADDAVFLGPDSSRFADFVAAELAARSWVGRLVDVGGGAGVGALTAAAGRARARLVLTDVNPKALRLAQVNAAHAGLPLETRLASGLEGVDQADVILANPPYIAEARQTYASGGGRHGGQASLDWTREALPRLAPGGRFLLYTGSAILAGGHDPLKSGLQQAAGAAGVSLAYRELDPDVFGEELERPAYADVERIAAVGAVFTRARAQAGAQVGSQTEAQARTRADGQP
jgi:methylase of polypeptide subunit release factors